ncbi:MAG: hypothetical protein WDZ82_02985 [Candidatus Paceibacterota bacterium]
MVDAVKTLHVRVVGPDEILWEGDATAVSAQNSDGPFDILPGHANYITICIDSDLTVHLPDSTQKEFKFKRFAIFTHQNTVSIYTEI